MEWNTLDLFVFSDFPGIERLKDKIAGMSMLPGKPEYWKIYTPHNT